MGSVGTTYIKCTLVEFSEHSKFQILSLVFWWQQIKVKVKYLV